MTPEELSQRASANLADTYMRLALAVPGTELHEFEEFHLCVGQVNHPICNFALKLNLNPWAARRLRIAADCQSAFNVFVAPSDTPEYLGELLQRADFYVAQRLVHMTMEPVSQTKPEGMVLVTGTERRDVAKFMSEQFFPQQTDQFRRIVADATAAPNSLEIYAARQRSRLVGAVLLNESNGILGCYNLCVDRSCRGRGIGSSMVKWVLDYAAARGLPLCLQCDPSLESWYSGLGFERSGHVFVYHLSNSQPSDIMDGS